MDKFFTVSQQIGMIVIFVLTGILAIKTKVLKEEALNYLAKLVINIAMPLTIFVGIVNKTTAEDLFNSLPILVVSLALEVGLFAFSWIVSRIMGLKGDQKNLFRCMTTFGNSIFIGIPLITALFPSKGLLYLSLYTIIDQSLIWTLGVKLTTHVEEKRNVPGAAERAKFAETFNKFVKNITTPALIGIVLGVIFVLFNIRLPEIINKPLTDMGSITTPVSMIYLGGFLCGIDFKKAISRIEFYIIALIKMLIFPIALFTVLTLIGFDPDAAFALSLVAGHPTMTSVVMFANLRGSDGEYACGGLMVTTVLAIVTLPVLSLVFEQIKVLFAG